MPQTHPIAVEHVITGLAVGGAQTMLYNLLSHGDGRRVAHRVTSLTEAGPVGCRLQELGVPVEALGMSRRLPSPADIARLSRRLRRQRPQVVQTWLYHADLVGGLAARMAGVRGLLWNIRHSDLDPTGTKRLTLWTARACARLSSWLPRAIVCCSEASREIHRAMGYDGSKMIVIPNGVDISAFKSDRNAGASLRQELQLAANSPLVGLVGRYHPQKDHDTFSQAAGRVARNDPSVRFLLCGEQIDWSNSRLADLLRRAGIADRCHLLGVRDDIADILNALDIAVSSSSFGEGFSNVIVEAMACGVPTVVTDVGDSAAIVGETGWVVPPRDSAGLAESIRTALSLSAEERQVRGLAARQRAEACFNIDGVVARYETLYADVAQAASGRR